MNTVNAFHIQEREDNEVLWRYGPNDGSSFIRDGEVQDSDLCETGILLTSDTRASINRAVTVWLMESGEGDAWWAEQ